MPRISDKRRFILWYLRRLEGIYETLESNLIYEQLTTLFIDSIANSSQGPNQDEESGDSNASSISSLSTISSISEPDMDVEIEYEFDLETSLMELMHFALTHRYMVERINWIPKHIQLYEQALFDMPESHFQQFFRMTPENFLWIASNIEGNPIFHSNSNTQQAPVTKQLAIALKRLTSESSTAAGLRETALMFGVGEGTIHLYTERVVLALSDKQLWKETIRWHTAEERVTMKSRLRDCNKSLWEDCIGFLDETLIPFKSKPFKNNVTAAGFWCARKARYGLQATIICDDTNRILHFSSRHPGAIHDSTAFKATAVYQQPEQYFAGHQFLIGDSAYELSRWLVTPFKRPPREQLSPTKKAFNTELSRVRVRVEHTIGILKARFSALRSLPQNGMDIRDSRRLQSVFRWIMACVVMHNWLISRGDRWEPEPSLVDDILAEELLEEQEELDLETGPSNTRRAMLYRDFIESL